MTEADQIQRREEWRRRIADFQASGQSGAAWCAAQGIKPHLLYYWAKRLTPPAVAAVTEAQWLPVKVSDVIDSQSVAGKGLDVRIGSATIEVRPGFNPRLLAEVVKVLATLC